MSLVSLIDSDVVLRNALAQDTGAGLVGTTTGSTVQDVLSTLAVIKYPTLSSARADTIKSDTVSITFKYGNVLYTKTGVTDVLKMSSGDGYLFYDAVGTEFKINVERRNRDISNVFCFSEIWQTADLDPTYFHKLTALGVDTLVVYTWYGFSFDTHAHFLNLCELYGFTVVLQAVPNQEYTSDIAYDFQYLQPLLNHVAVVGLYLFDEPSLATMPLSRQALIIEKARELSIKPLYAATNSELVAGAPPIHKDIDFVFASNYSHFVSLDGLLYYAGTTWALLDENTLRKGRVIPLMTSYWYEAGSSVLDTPRMVAVNNWIASNFSAVGMWMFFGNRDATHHYLENHSEIFDISRAALSLGGSRRAKVTALYPLLRAGALPASFKYQTRVAGVSDMPALDPTSTGVWSTPLNTLALRRGDSFVLDLGDFVKVNYVSLSFVDNNGSSNTVVLSLTYNPHLGTGVPDADQRSVTGGGDASWVRANQTTQVRKIKVTVVSMSTPSVPSDIIYFNRVSVLFATA